MTMYVALLIFGQLCLLLGISGNIFVLYATIAHKAIKLDTMSTWIIKNLAVVDLCNCVIVLIPAIVTHYAEGKWVLGRELCYFHASQRFTYAVANLVLINFLSANKLRRCIYPLRNLHPSRIQKNLMTILTAVISLMQTILTLTGVKEQFVKIQYLHIRENDFLKTEDAPCIPIIVMGTNRIFYIIAVFESILFNAIPCLAMVIITAVLLVYAARKTNRPINTKNILIVIIVTVIFLISFLPFFVFLVQDLTYRFENQTKQSHAFSEHLHTMHEWTWSLMFLSSWANPAIYVIMNESFRGFTMGRLFCRQLSRERSRNFDLRVAT
jgi:hypothetical protein